MRSIVPFAGPIVKLDGITSARCSTGIPLSQENAVMEILTHPSYVALTDTLIGNSVRTDKDGRRQAGRPRKYSVDLLLAIVIVALVCNLDLRAARNRLYASPRLRQHLGLPELTEDDNLMLANMRGGAVTANGYPVENTIRDFIERWTAETYPQFIEMVEATYLQVAADAIHRHDLDCGWIATDAKRARGSTDKESGDEGTSIWARSDQQPFNQRHVWPVINGGSAPFIYTHHVCAPEAELTTYIAEALPKITDAGERLGNIITAMRRAEGNPRTHRGLRRAAIATDRFSDNEPGVTATMEAGFYSAARKPEETLTKHGERRVRRGGQTINLVLRNDGAVLCPCTEGTKIGKRPPMLVLANDFPKEISVRCTDPTCVYSRKKVSLSARDPDRNTHLPGTSATLGDWNLRTISQLPVWDDDYIARRFLALQRVEWVHGVFEFRFGLGHKNRDWTRRTITTEHVNRVWWSLGALVWNITLALNLDDGHGQLVELDKEERAKTVKNYWKKDGQIRAIKQRAEKRRAKRAASEAKRHAERTPRTRDDDAAAA